MGFKDLKKLFEKKNLIFLILVVWLLFAVTTIYWEEELRFFFGGITAQIIFYPLLIICMVLVIYSLFLRGDITKLTWKNILKAAGIFAIALIAYFILGAFLIVLIQNFASIVFVISIFSLIFITAIFAMYFCFENGVKLDETFYKAREPFGFLLRWLLFLGGVGLSILIILIIPSFAAEQPILVPREGTSPEISFMVSVIPTLTILIILGLTVIALFFVLIKGRLNAWLAIFFIFASLYISFLIVNAVLSLKSGTTSVPLVIAKISLFVFDLLVLLISISTLVGKKAELISEKLKFIKADAILIWLIFSKAAYEYSEALLPSAEVSALKTLGVFLLFIPLMVIMGIIGIIQYGKLKEIRKREKIRKKRVRKSKRQVRKVKKEREKTDKKAEKKQT